jgi:methylglutaconyl-CoA hydratase
MTAYQTITHDVEPSGVVRLTLNRPDKHNALNAEMIDELTAAAKSLANNKSARVVVLSAAGKSFCAGGDLEWMKLQFEATPERREQEARRLATMLRLVDQLPQFVIGAIDGAAYGGGVGVASVCDLVVATPAARFALTETKLGIIPATISPYVYRRIGATALRRLALHGEAFTVTEAESIGLVSEVAGADELDSAVSRHVAQALTCAPGALADAKRLFRSIAAGEAGEAETIAALVERWQSDEAQAGIQAFFSKAKPPWQN